MQKEMKKKDDDIFFVDDDDGNDDGENDHRQNRVGSHYSKGVR